MYLPVTCTMRCTDIWRSLIALKILNNEGKKILFFGTTMFQKRNKHNLINDLKDELPMFVHSEKIIQIITVFEVGLRKAVEDWLLRCSLRH